MDQRTIYSIGHGTRKKELFLELLHANNIHYLVDVRSKPFSRFNPQYNQKSLKEYLADNRVVYVFMGDTLGGRPEDKSCYTTDGKIDYEKIRTKGFFKTGIERLKKAYNQNLPVAIMCSESKPTECHRTKLIGEELAQQNIIIVHIDEKGSLKDHFTVMKEINRGKIKGLFENDSI